MPQPTAPFAEALLAWATTLDRPMPWRGLRDPYRVWLSEVILQQTRVAQGLGYYERFLAAFPTVRALAAADEREVLALWQGLGYYSRARNLHKAARQVAGELGGVFPPDYRGLLTLPGVGPYSAAAIASFCYGEPVAVVDGNVYRVLARHFGVDAPIDKPAGQRTFRALADELLPPDTPAAYNQAIMDFGATVCTPRSPACGQCPVRTSCAALSGGRVGELPVKAKRPRRRSRYFDYLELRRASDDALLLRRRPAGDIWEGLWDLPLVESADGFAEDAAVTAAAANLTPAAAPPPVPAAPPSLPVKHVLSHQDLYARHWRFRVDDADAEAVAQRAGGRWVDGGDLGGYGLPRLLQRHLERAELF